MKDLLISIASGLVNEPDQVTVEVDDINEEGVVVYHLDYTVNKFFAYCSFDAVDGLDYSNIVICKSCS